MIRVQVKTFVPPEDTIWLIRDPFGTVAATAPGDERDGDGRLLTTRTALSTMLADKRPRQVRKAGRQGWTAERKLRSDAREEGIPGA